MISFRCGSELTITKANQAQSGRSLSMMLPGRLKHLGEKVLKVSKVLPFVKLKQDWTMTPVESTGL